MPEKLVSCPQCGTTGFSERGLKAHRCKGINRNPKPSDKSDMSDPSDASDPAWEVMAPAPAALSPAALVANINDHHARAQNDAAHAKAYADSAVQAAILAGLQLVELKTATPHGQWEGLLAGGAKRVGKSNGAHVRHLDFGRDTARRYIAVATQLVSKKLQPEQSAVLMELARGGPMTPAAAELLREITPDKSLRRTYLELGIVKPTAKELAAMAAPPDDPAAATPEPKAAAAFRSAKDSARIDWYGTPKPGRVEPGSFMGLVLTELSDPARGSARLLTKADLDGMAADLTEFSRRLREYAKEKR
jgi:hypothetical protein